MAKYLIEANYVGDGVRGLLDEGGTRRVEAVEKALADMGGSLEAFYFAFGDTDVYAICDLPDNVSAAALALGIGASNRVELKTTVLITPREMDQASTRHAAYRAPGT